MAEWDGQREALAGLGFGLAAVSVDPPERAARMRLRLGLGFPLLCDPGREAVRAWDVFNPGERGGIARPATAVIAPDGSLVRLEPEGMARRLRPAELVAWLAQRSGPLRPRGLVPRLRDWARALRP